MNFQNGYDNFAEFYDTLTALTDDEDCPETVYTKLLTKNERGILLDLGCGTGKLSLAAARMGFDVLAVDNSPNMLQAARERFSKAVNSGEEFAFDIQFICQNAAQLDLFGTVDVVVCARDTLNHLASKSEFEETVRRVSLFLNPGGVFYFDVNTKQKHREILGNNTFTYETDNLFCVWQNNFDDNSAVFAVDIDIDFFSRQNQNTDLYERSQCSFTEIAFDEIFISEILTRYGFEFNMSDYYNDGSNAKLLYICRKTGERN
ncbi:MAG: class I SAM-dependent methyltransferase [Ruminococcus sp.]|jgi:SAM-dependent methyltransferase|nr:class I SAM-dependent methyltransferase [Ruminococcus sp.]